MSLVHSGEYSTAEVADFFGVGRSTVYRAIERQRVEARSGLAETTPKRRHQRATAPAALKPKPLRDAGASRRSSGSKRPVLAPHPGRGGSRVAPSAEA